MNRGFIALAARPFFIFTAMAVLFGCATSFCGAPCEKRGSSPPPDREIIVNQYGSIFGHMEIAAMTKGQILAEKNSLEALLKLSDKDAQILKAVKEHKADAFPFSFEDVTTGGSRFNSSGKLRRDSASDDPLRKIPRMISESNNRQIFERHRQVRLQMLITHPEPVDTLPQGLP